MKTKNFEREHAESAEKLSSFFLCVLCALLLIPSTFGQPARELGFFLPRTSYSTTTTNGPFYVDPSGSDLANGLSSGTAWQHLVFAGTNKAASNCIIYLTSGATYNEGGILFTNPNVTVTTTGAGAAWITNTSTALSAVAILSVSNSGISLNNLHIRGNSSWVSFASPSNGPAGIGLSSAGAVTFSNVTIQNCQVDQVVAGITGFVTDPAVWPNLIISNCAVHDCAENGIFLSGTAYTNYNFPHATIIGNTVSNIYGQAARTCGYPIGLVNASNSLVGGNTCHDSAISTTTGAATGAAGIFISYSDSVTVASNECFAIHSTQPTGVDGLGIQLGTSAQNCIVAGNYVHDNGGPGIYLYYAGGTNTVRFNIAINDGLETSSTNLKSELSVVASQTANLDIYANTLICMRSGCIPIIYPANQTAYGTNHILNNILASSNSLSLYWYGANTALDGNDYWRQDHATMAAYWQGGVYSGLNALTNSASKPDGGGFAQNAQPLLLNGIPSVTNGNAATIKGLTNWDVSYQSTLLDAGQDIAWVYGLNLGGADFHGNSIPLPYYSIGATLTGGDNFNFVTNNTYGLVGWWKLDSDYTDASGQGNTGTAVGSPSLVAAAITNGVSVNGSQRVNLPAAVATLLKSQSQLTLMAWLYQNATQGQYCRAFGAYTNNAADFSISFNSSAGGGHNELDFAVQNGGTGTQYAYSSSNALPVGSWHHVVYAFDGTKTGNLNRLQAFLDSQLLTLSTNAGGTIPATTAATLGQPAIGDFNAGGGYGFNGIIDEVRLYNRALSTNEIATQYGWPLGGKL